MKTLFLLLITHFARMLRPASLLFFIMLTGGFLIGQPVNDCSYKRPKEADVWCFYSNLRLDFTSGAPVLSTLPGTLPAGKGCASICDANGNLKLYTDGTRLWDAGSSRINESLKGDLGCTQSSLIVPNPANNRVYYVFTTHLLLPAPFGTNGLNCFRVNLDSTSVGDTLQAHHLLAKTPEKISGVKHANGIDYWVVAHGWDDNSFHAFRVTSKGVDTIPVTSFAGMVQTGTLASRNTLGAMKLSPDGTKLALAYGGQKLVEWFDFNASTGVVSNARTIPAPDNTYTYGIEFSPDGTKLYFTTSLISTFLSDNLYQVDLLAGSAPLKLNVLSTDDLALQLASDGKIYVSRPVSGYMGVIENPNRPDVACNFIEDGLFLNGSICKYSTPNFIQSYFNIPAVDYDTKCLGDGTIFTIHNQSNIDSVVWNFGDPATGFANTDRNLQPTHVFSAPGDYTVTLTEWFNLRSFNTSVDVTIHPLPPKSFTTIGPDSLYILPGSATILDAGALMTSYQWNTGATTQTITVGDPGYYDVTIIDTNCCMQQDTIKVMLLDLHVPSAFSPNHDGLNDVFHVKGPTKGIDNYHFYIYNRWGQLLWESESFFDGWDGKFKGVECPMGVYTWVMKFGVTGEVLNKDKIVKRGVLTIVK